jgi:hypothetical protein
VNDVVQLAAVAFSLALLAVVLELVRRRKLTEEHSLIWVAGAVALLGLSVWRNVLDVAAQAVGIHYPPALLLLALTGFVFLVSLYFSVVISRQRQEIERMLEDLALLDAEVRQLRDSGRPVSAAQMVADAAREGQEAAEPGRLSREHHISRVQPDDGAVAKPRGGMITISHANRAQVVPGRKVDAVGGRTTD